MNRPKREETEEDILALQKAFLTKRKLSDVQRDIVSLCPEGNPKVKKIKNENVKFEDGSSQHVEAMEEAGAPAVTEVQERRHIGPPVTMTTLHTKQGFPIVRSLDLSKSSTGLKGGAGPGEGQGGSRFKKRKAKKSLFLEQFENKELGYFGIEETTVSEGMLKEEGHVRDVVEPIHVGEKIDVEDKKMETTYEGKGEGGEDGSPALLGDWLKSSLVLREGEEEEAEEMGDKMREEIHQENLQLLSKLSEEEILGKKQQLEQAMKPEMLSFLRSRHQKKHAAIASGEPPSSMAGTVSLTADQDDVTRATTGVTEHVQPPQGWLHMDMVEKEKLEWMTDVTRPLSCPALDKIDARFSLDGTILPRGQDLPSHLGLHHHGNEPEAAGYTLSELLPLTRSTVLQQRVLSLQVLTCILKRAWQREYVGVVEGFVVDRLVQAQLPLLLRLALDDSVVGVVKMAIAALHSLMVVPAEEVMMDEFSLCHSGCLLPKLHPYWEASPKKEEIEEEESDTEMLQRDMVAGYLKMNFLPRVRYILEVVFPLELEQLHHQLLEVLTHMSRHSLSAATQVADCPRLLDVVVGQYLPLSWQDKEGEGHILPHPLVSAIKLVKSLCSAGPSLAKRLLSKYKLASVLVCYAVSLPSDQPLPLEEACPLATASLGLWRTLLLHRLADDVFSDVFPVLLKQLQMLAFSCDLSPLESKRMAGLLGVVEAAISLAGTSQEELRVSASQCLPPPSVTWPQARGMAAPLLHALASWSRVGSAEDQGALDKMMILSSLFNALATYYDKLAPQAGRTPGPLEVVQEVEKLSGSVLEEFFTSSIFITALRDLSGQGMNMRSADLVVGVVRLTLSCMRLHVGLQSRLASSLFTTAAFSQLLDPHLTNLQEEVELRLLGCLKSQLFRYCVEMFAMWAATSPAMDEALTRKVQALAFLQPTYSPMVFHPVFYRNEEMGTIRAVYEQTVGRGAFLPMDWVLMPLVEEYNKTQSSRSHEVSTVCVEATLRFLLHLEENNKLVFSKLSSGARFARVLCTFLLDSSLFLDSVCRGLLKSLLGVYVRESQAMDLTSNIPGLLSFSDLYQSFLEHFAAVSYGDDLFASYLLLPLQQRFPVKLRQQLWGNHAHVLSFINISVEESEVDVRGFLYPPETDAVLVDMYLSALATGKVRRGCDSIMYLIAVHHVHNAILSSPSPSLTYKVKHLQNHEVRQDVELYDGHRVTSPLGFQRSGEVKETPNMLES